MCTVYKVFEVSPRRIIEDGSVEITPEMKVWISTPPYSETPFINQANDLKERLLSFFGFSFEKAKCTKDDFSFRVVMYCQKQLKKEEALLRYNKRGGEDEYFQTFYGIYDGFYDMVKGYDFASDMSFIVAFNAIRWYAFYKKIGHNDDWCDCAKNYFSCFNWSNVNLEDFADKEISFDNDLECLQRCIILYPDEHELEIHREFVKKYFSKCIPL